MNYTDRIGHAYFFAKKYIITKGYWDEIEWQESVTYSSLTMQMLLEETAWVIISSGLHNNVVQSKFPFVREAMLNFSSPKLIFERREDCFNRAIEEFKHPGKINAIISVAEMLVGQSIETVKGFIDIYGMEYLKTFPYIGNVTVFHLAKNIGLNVAKPDRHLARMAIALGFSSADELCGIISEQLGESKALVDLVLWRYATLDRQYLEKITRLLKGH